MSETSPAPVVEVRESRVSTDWKYDKKCKQIWNSWTLHTQYHVIVDGRRVDSFLTRERAERAAAALRAMKAIAS